jgi:hypothetical protein
MYQFSRSIYRELAPAVIEDPTDPTGCTKKQRLLDACEATMQRLAYDRPYFAYPARTLFGEVRTMFALQDQRFVRRVIERRVELALDCLDRMPAALGLDREPVECKAYTRRGTACQRTPAPGSDYCPSHSHLEEPFPALAAVPEEAAVSGGTAVG